MLLVLGLRRRGWLGFKADLSRDRERFIAHCKWLLSQNCGLAVFGTNSEANSMSVDEKLDLLDALIDGGVPAAALMPGTGACALSDSVKLTAGAVKRGCGGVLMLPPFYYKGVSDEGLFRAFAQVIDAVADDHPSQIRVRMQCGPHMLLARITQRAWHKLSLQAGQAVWAQLKAVSVLR